MRDWTGLEDRVRKSMSGPWRQVCLSPEDFLELMDERKWHPVTEPPPDADCWVEIAVRTDMNDADRTAFGEPVPNYAVVQSAWLRQGGTQYITNWRVLVEP